MDKIYETIVFEALDIKQWRTLIPEKRGENEENPEVAPSHCLEKSSRAQSREGYPEEAQQIPWDREVKLSWAVPDRTLCWGAAEGPPQAFTRILTSTVCGEMFSDRKKNHSKRLTIPRSHREPVTKLFPQVRHEISIHE